MNARVFKARTRHSRVQPSEALQEKLLDAVATAAASEHVVVYGDPGDSLTRFSSGTRPLQSHRGPSPAPSADTTPSPSRKRRPDATTPPPPKRARLTRADTQQHEVEEEEAVQTDEPSQTTLAQPKPKAPYPSFLKDFVDPVNLATDPVPVHRSVFEWLESVRSDREERCRSDGYLRPSDHDLSSRQLSGSAPDMGRSRDADGFAVPLTPGSTGSRSFRADADAGSIARSDLTGAPSDSGRSTGRSLVEDPNYRKLNLAAKNIYLRSSREKYPQHIASLVDDVGKDRSSPAPSPDQVWQDLSLEDLETEGFDEPKVEKYFQSTIFSDPKSRDSLARSDRQPMLKHVVPNTDARFRLSTPIPDMIYGYNHRDAFPQQRTQLISMGTEPMANSQGLTYPFFVIEFKGNSGDLWVATNQCLGGSMSCVNMAERLNQQLKECKSDKIRPIDSTTFSIAMNGTEARLYISWKHNELDYYMQKVKGFLLQEPEHYIEFRKYVRNIIDWGKDKRLKEIRDSLESLLEASRRRVSTAAKSRPSPSGGSGTSRSKRHKSSSSRKNSSRSNSVQAQTDELWEQNEAELQDSYPHAEHDGQGQALTSFDPIPSASFATAASGLNSSLDTQRDSLAPSISHHPPQPQNFVKAGHYVSQEIDDDSGSAPAPVL
ncbi:hypothetical protein DHEL01_v213025 [Diaporthe helianthi]|uniref:DUF7924 domain-containing protein n=1 Tax=Diaporthe helianthi TaxID=158607 RepID=A0A2P5HEA2_DIAHE|nr:hypothetical protein DHEL01_v213025 [Diaporthe helianthi]